VEERSVEVAPGVALHVVDTPGDAPAFLLVHGLASNLRLWDGVAARLAAAGHRVVAVDLRGHGRSDKPDGGYDVGTVAADLAVLVERLDLDRPIAVGQSWGGNVVLELAWAHPDAVGAIACVDGGWIELADRFADWDTCRATLAPPPTTGVALAAIERGFRQAHPDWPDTGIAGALACFEVRADGTVAPWLGPEHHLAVLHGLWSHRPSTRYPGIAVPVLLLPAGLPGGHDHPTTVAVAVAERSLADSRTAWIDGDHDLHAQHPDLVAAELLASAEALVRS
jgi:pimeloyl-ACP methyl ester carboxylesterase